MKINILSFLLIIIAFACSDPEPNLQLSNPEAFAFDLGGSWEVNASIKAVGFLVEENEETYSANLSYSVDLISYNDSLLTIYTDKIEEKENEEILDLMLEAQIEVDSTFEEGEYKLLFHVTDILSNQNDTISVAFNLSK